MLVHQKKTGKGKGTETEKAFKAVLGNVMFRQLENSVVRDIQVCPIFGTPTIGTDNEKNKQTDKLEAFFFWRG